MQIDRFRRLDKFGFLVKIFKHRPFTAFIGLIIYSNGLLSFIILSDGLSVGSKIYSGASFNNIASLGSSNFLSTLTVFSSINSVEFFPFSGFKLARAAGSRAILVSLNKGLGVIKLNSGWHIKISALCTASLGSCSNPLHDYITIGKAGRQRAFGIRPTVRGVIKNPCDHPHGGGEGRGSPPAAQVSPWGYLTKGTPTKNKKIDRLKRRLFKKI